MESKSILSSLCSHYMEECSADSPVIKRLFSELYGSTACLTFNEQDSIVTIVCKLCSEHEYRAYSAGFTDAIRLTSEIHSNMNQDI